MKIEDIKLKIGDKITYDDNTIFYISDYAEADWSFHNINKVIKIERYEYQYDVYDYEDETKVLNRMYDLKTIYERKEDTPKGIEELNLHFDDKYYISTQNGDTLEISSFINTFNDKINEIIKEVNKMKKEEK